MRAPSEWNVLTSMSRASSPANACTRSRISVAARLVNVTTRMRDGSTLWPRTRWTQRCTSVFVLPEPAPASTSSGPSVCVTARRCSGFRPCSQGDELLVVLVVIGGRIVAGVRRVNDLTAALRAAGGRRCASLRRALRAQAGDAPRRSGGCAARTQELQGYACGAPERRSRPPERAQRRPPERSPPERRGAASAYWYWM